jgi:hypothetical protein
VLRLGLAKVRNDYTMHHFVMRFSQTSSEDPNKYLHDTSSLLEAEVRKEERKFVDFFTDKTKEKREEFEAVTAHSWWLYGIGLFIGVLGLLVGVEVKPKWPG